MNDFRPFRRAVLLAPIIACFGMALAAWSGDTLLLSSGPLPTPPPGFQKVTLFQETFDTDTASTAATLAAYPAWSTVGSVTSAIVSGGVLQLEGSGGIRFVMDGSSFTGPFFAHADLTRTSGGTGSNPVGFALGPNQLVFHHGYPGGAFRFEGSGQVVPNGGGNIDMGFTTNFNVPSELHHYLIEADGLGGFDVTVVDAANLANVYTETSFVNTGAIGGDMGLYFANSGATAYFDNFEIFVFAPVPLAPEPASIVVFGVGLVGAAAFAWRRRRAAR